MEKNKTFRYALIGCGRISAKHLEALSANAALFEPVAMVDVVRERAEAAANEARRSHPGARVAVHEDYRKMIEECRPEIVAVATESGFHAPIALDLIAHGCHVILEKPMALSTQDCDRIVKAARRKNVTVGVCFQNRFNPPILKMRQAVEEERLGRLLHGQVSIRWNRDARYYAQGDWRCTWEQDGGCLMNQSTHGIDLLQWMMGGDIRSVTGVLRKFGSPREAEDFGAAIVEFGNGSVGIVESSVNVYPKNLEEKLSVFGTKGTVVIGGLAVNYVETWRVAGEPEVVDDRNDPPNVYGFGHNPLYKDFHSAVVEGRKPFVSAEDGRKAVELVLAIYRSMKTGERVVFPFDFDSREMKGSRLS